MLLLALSIAAAWDRASRPLELEGTGVDPVFALDLDGQGRVWAGGPGGLVLIDAPEVRPIAPEVIRERVDRLTACGDEVWALRGGRAVWRVRGESAAEVPAPGGGPWRDARDLACVHGEVWVVAASGIWRGGQRVDPGLDPWTVRETPDGALVGAADAVWRRSAAGWERLFDAARPVALWSDRRRVVVLERHAALRVWEDGQVRSVPLSGERAISLVERSGTLWVSTDRTLYAVGPDLHVEIISADELRFGGPLLVGREGELWLGTVSGVRILPEPDTVILRERDGLISDHTRFVTAGPDGLWVTTWHGIGRVVRDGSALVTDSPADLRAVQRPCLGPDGALWVSGVRVDHSALGRWNGRSFDWHDLPPGVWTQACAAADEAVWWWTTAGIWRSDGGPPEQVSGWGSAAEITWATFSPEGEAWLARMDDTCRWRPGEAAPACQPAEGPSIYSLAALPDGTRVEGTFGDGARDEGGRVVGRADTPSSEVLGLSASPRGGLWLAGPELRARFERVDRGWRRVEDLDAWAGVPASTALDILELPGGEVWVATGIGLIRVPPSARDSDRPPPPLRVTRLLVDGVATGLSEPITVPAAHNRWQVELAARTWRAPHALRLRVRLGPDQPWSSPTRSRVLSFVGLPAGEHVLEAQATLDGERWSDLERPLRVQVLPMWYQRLVFKALVVLLVGVGAWAFHRQRLRRAVDLERQRLRIAMDLHDDLGSGLGSVGVLATLAASEDVDPAVARGAAAEIAAAASSLGESLGDIVWSLRPASRSTLALALRLREHARRLVPGPELSLHLDVPDVLLDPAVCRNVHWTAVEALHNTVKHARARHIEVSLTPGRVWSLVVQDDGQGIGEPRGEGLGLLSMRRRAEEIGASLQVGPAPGGGTRVELRFHVQRRGGAP